MLEVGPLKRPRSGACLRVISCITDRPVVRKILRHLGLWLANARPVPRVHCPPHVPDNLHDPSFSQLPPAYEDDFSQLSPAEWDF